MRKDTMQTIKGQQLPAFLSGHAGSATNRAGLCPSKGQGPLQTLGRRAVRMDRCFRPRWAAAGSGSGPLTEDFPGLSQNKPELPGLLDHVARLLDHVPTIGRRKMYQGAPS